QPSVQLVERSTALERVRRRPPGSEPEQRAPELEPQAFDPAPRRWRRRAVQPLPEASGEWPARAIQSVVAPAALSLVVRSWVGMRAAARIEDQRSGRRAKSPAMRSWHLPRGKKSSWNNIAASTSPGPRLLGQQYQR